MSLDSPSFDLADLVRGLLSSPLVCLVIALLITAVILFFVSPSTDPASRRAHESPRTVVERHSPEQRTLGLVALAIVFVFVVEFVLRGYVFTNSETISWWRFAVPVACAALGLALALAVIATRGSSQQHAAGGFSTRRSWMSFSRRADLIIVAVVTLLLAITTVLGGITSSSNDQGQFAWLEIPIPNEPDVDPIRALFYGWAYGIPVLICVAALVPLLWAVLERNAARPFLLPDSTTSERAARRTTAAMTARVAAGAMLLALAEAWDLIAGTGSGTQLTVVANDGSESTYESAWRYAELAIAAGWIAPILEITAFVLLLAAAYAGLRRHAVARASASGDRNQMNAEAAA